MLLKTCYIGNIQSTIHFDKGTYEKKKMLPKRCPSNKQKQIMNFQD